MTELHFLPWVRDGLVAGVGTPSAQVLARRASVDAFIDVNQTKHSQRFVLAGPGDVASVDRSLFGRRYPEEGTTDAEPNYFVSVDVLAADLPWRYTPAAADGSGRIPPWLVLVVVEAADGVSLVQAAGAPLPQLHVLPPADTAVELPDLSDSASWAHVQSSVPATQVAANLHDPNKVIARLLCPRRLEADRSYIAAVVPAFAAGRTTGMGLTPDTSAISSPAWGDDAAAGGGVVLPAYLSWTFATGPAGDFEALASRLHPAPFGSRTGLHTMDISAMSPSLPAEGPATVDYRGVLRGPLTKPDTWDSEHRDVVQPVLRKVIDAAAIPPVVTAIVTAAYDPDRDDPRLGPALYGARSAALTAIAAPDEAEGAWTGQVNLSPPLRAAAGLGADLVRSDQEEFVAAAWTQVGDAKEAQALVFRASLAAVAGGALARRVASANDEVLVQLTAPQHRTMADASFSSVAERIVNQDVAAGMTDPALARIARSSSVVGRSFSRALGATSISMANVVDSSASQVLVRAHFAARDDASALSSLKAFAVTQAPSGITSEPRILIDGAATIDENPARLDTFVPDTVFDRTGIAVDVSAVLDYVRQRENARVAARPPLPDRQVPGRGQPGELPDAELPDLQGLDPNRHLDVATVIRRGLDPSLELTTHLQGRIPALAAGLVGILGYPTMPGLTVSFDDPLSLDLISRSAELFMPGAEDLANDGVALTEVERGVVSAFMAGANEALLRELLWRGVPVAIPQTPMRRFWESAGADDINAINNWTGGIRDQLIGVAASGSDLSVIVARASLFRRYPGTRIMLVGAKWDGDTTVADHARQIDPVLLGSLDTRTRFFGFPFDVDTLLGDRSSLTRTEDSAGWYVAFEEEPNEARFGLDVARRDQTDISDGANAWSDLTWGHLDDGDGPPSHAHGDGLPGRTDASIDGVVWGRNAAHQAHICYQLPFRALIHADALVENS